MSMITAVGERTGQRIRDARLAAGLSQTAFAAALGTSQRAVTRWESGRVTPGEGYRQRINDVTGKRVFGDDEEPGE